uniref:Uncharacterized protein n=1 Tax=Odontella aurita TaxID=265563 RepID=A0A7S4NID5_9STRA|mmetsp:Transcript_8960/g.26794  ORF Transcript_8960/g.26794 Transcript_8960/m.26794 type:complete len:194 (+) Transcript_8960:141-722(+)
MAPPSLVSICLRRFAIPTIVTASFAASQANAGFVGFAGLATTSKILGREHKFTKTTIREMSSKECESSGEPFIPADQILFVECGFGNDGHGQSATKAAVRACRNAIEFNSIPSINRLVPGGYDRLKLDVLLAVPPKYREGLDLDAVRDVFPYGETKITIQDGGMVAPSGIAIEKLGDKNQDMVVVCSSVTVGY